MADLKAFAEQLVNLTVKEVNELAEILKNEYGIEPAAIEMPAQTDTFKINKKTYKFYIQEINQIKRNNIQREKQSQYNASSSI